MVVTLARGVLRLPVNLATRKPSDTAFPALKIDLHCSFYLFKESKDKAIKRC